MTAFFTRLMARLDDIFNTSEGRAYERFLSQATSHEHLESLERQWERNRQRAPFLMY